MISNEYTSGGVTLVIERTITSRRSRLIQLTARRELRGSVLDDDDRGVDHFPYGDGKSRERQQVDRLAERRKRKCGEECREDEHADRRKRAANVAEKNQYDNDDDCKLVAERYEEIPNRVPDQR